MTEAALRLGLCYVGVTTKASHTKWLGNVLDRITMNHIATPGRPCYSKELASLAQSHFGERLAGMEESANMEDVDLAELLPDTE